MSMHPSPRCSSSRQDNRRERERLTNKQTACTDAIEKCARAVAAHEDEQRRLQRQISALSETIVRQLDALLSERMAMSAGAIGDDPQLAMLSQKNAHLIDSIVNIIGDYRKMDGVARPAADKAVDQIEIAAASLKDTYRQYTEARNTQLQAIEPLLTILTDPNSDFVARHRLDRESEHIQEQIQIQKKDIARISAERAQFQQRIEKLTAHLTETELQYERQKMHVGGLAETNNRLAAQIRERKRERDRIHNRISGYRDQQEAVKKQISAAKETLKEREKSYATCQKRGRSLNVDIGRIQKSITTVDTQSQKIYRQLQQLRTQLSRADEVHSKAEAKVELAAAQFREQFGQEIAHYKADDADAAADSDALTDAPAANAPASDRAAPTSNRTASLASQIERLRGDIRKLGAVNPMAEDEFTEARSRYTMTKEHYRDLVDAQNDLSHLTARINQESSDTLKKTVHAIAAHFEQICARLFSDGSGIIRLTTPESPLDSDIEIMVRPEGKKNEKIEHLSGGERALVSLALLFALYRHNPSRVVFLDEIDAALDEDNAVRIAHYIRDHLQSTQSVIVTHNRQTISIAQTIVGITMEEYGASKALEISLSDYLNIGRETEQE